MMPWNAAGSTINAFKVKFPSAHRDAVAEIAKRKQERARKTNILPAELGQSADVFSRTGRPIVAPLRRE